MKKMLSVLAGTAGLSFLALYGSAMSENRMAVSINEVCSNNRTVIQDGMHEGCDYIELYNSWDEERSLEGWFLSDDPENLQKYEIGPVTVSPHGYVLFFGKDEDASQEQMLNFKIKSTGEKIFLSNQDGEIEDTVYVPELLLDTSYARRDDGGKEWIRSESTPGETNDHAERVTMPVLEQPVFSRQSGFYEKEFVLKIKAEFGSTVYYTTDGSEPTKDSVRYDRKGISIQNAGGEPNVLNAEKKVVADWKDYEPVQEPVDKAVVIRAAAFDRKGRKSPVSTAIYFVGMEKYRDQHVVSIVADPEKLIGEEGIFVTGKTYDEFYLEHEMSKDQQYFAGWTDHYELANFWKKGRLWEVAADFSLFQDGNPYIQQKAGIRVNGNFSRNFPVKDLRLISRKDYSGNRFFDSRIFPGIDSHAYLLVSDQKKAVFPEMAEGTQIGFQKVLEDCPVFINGEYWYTGCLMERYDEDYIAQKYRVSPENVLLIKDTKAESGEKNEDLYEEMIGLLMNDDLENEEICRQIYEKFDMQSFIDWMCYHLYLQNDDVSFLHNLYLWRTIKPEDGAYGDCKWRFLVYDMDHAAPGKNEKRGRFSDYQLLRYNKPYKRLKELPEFCRQFVLSFQDLANRNFRPEQIEKQLEKFGLDLSYADEFFLRRFETAMEDLAVEFQLQGTVETVSLSVSEPEGGQILLNGRPLEMTEGQWEGKYFTDYPLEIEALANPGWRFAGWEGDGMEEGSRLILQPEKDAGSAKAVFVRDDFFENTSLE